MADMVDLSVFFNFRSPYCYLASKTMFDLLDDFNTRLLWRPLGGWDGRSSPERAKLKIPIARQDVARWAKRMGICYNPPPASTDPTLAALGSLLAERKDCLQEYIVRVMDSGCAEGNDIGDRKTLVSLAKEVGLDEDEFEAALDAPELQMELTNNWKEAQERGVIGVPTFLVDDQIFWGNDRLEFIREYLTDKCYAKRGC